jgi:hypothetical protein
MGALNRAWRILLVGVFLVAASSSASAKRTNIADCHGDYRMKLPAPGSARYMLFAVARAGDEEREWAQIRDVATGRLAAQFELPPRPVASYDPGAIAVGADNRSFFLHIRNAGAESAPRYANSDGFTEPSDFYRVRINEAGHVIQTCRILRWLTSDYGTPKEISLSPDGTRLAFVDTAPAAYRGPAPDSIMVVDAVTRQRWTWHHHGEMWAVTGLSWLPDGRRIALSDSDPGSFGRILDTARSGDPSKISTPIHLTVHDPRFSRPHSSRWINQDGTTLYLTVQYWPPEAPPAWTGVAEFDIATGRQRRILFQTSQATVPGNAAGTCLSGDGRVLFIRINYRVYRIDTATGAARRLPYAPDLVRRFAC